MWRREQILRAALAAAAATGLAAATAVCSAAEEADVAPSGIGGELAITSPLDGVVFPRDFAAPAFNWTDSSGAGRWQLRVEIGDGSRAVEGDSDETSWQPIPGQWEEIKARSVSAAARLTVRGLSGNRVVSAASVRFSTSADPVGAPIFYREVPTPLPVASMNRMAIRWRLGHVSSAEEPRTVLEHVRGCANCHSFSRDGSVLAMDVDYGSDQGSYAIAPIGPEVVIGREQLISWTDFERQDGHRTLGLLSRISPDGRWVVSTVKETAVRRPLLDPFVPQLFFPVRGILVAYDRTARRFFAVPGADDRDLVQTDPAWSPDGEWLVFARATALPLAPGEPPERVPKTVSDEFVSGRAKFRYDLYRLPFHSGRGGPAEPLAGASHNGRSNYFARYSPDGRWIVFCQSDSFMFNQPDSALHIVPSDGGAPRRLGCNAEGRMSSWHSWSPNGRWLVFASKANGPYTQLWLTHIDEGGNDTPPVVLERFTPPDRAANLPEFVDIAPDQLRAITLDEAIR